MADDDKLRLEILDEIRELHFGPSIPAHAFTDKMAAERWGCAKDTARRLLVKKVEAGEFTRGKRPSSVAYWYWPVEEEGE